MMREKTLLTNLEKFELSLIRSCQNQRKYMEAICDCFSNINATKSEEIRTVPYLCMRCPLHYHNVVMLMYCAVTGQNRKQVIPGAVVE